MLTNPNRLISKIIFTGLIINTLPIHLPMHAQPKGQDPAALKREIARDIRAASKKQ